MRAAGGAPGAQGAEGRGHEPSPWEERARQGKQAQDPLVWAAAAGCAAWVCPARLAPG